MLESSGRIDARDLRAAEGSENRLTVIEEPAGAETSRAGLPRGWFAVLLLFFPAAFVQASFLACACAAGSAKANAALFADLAIIARALVGLIQRDRSRTWVVYAILYVLIIPITSYAVGWAGHH